MLWDSGKHNPPNKPRSSRGGECLVKSWAWGHCAVQGLISKGSPCGLGLRVASLVGVAFGVAGFRGWEGGKGPKAAVFVDPTRLKHPKNVQPPEASIGPPRTA